MTTQEFICPACGGRAFGRDTTDDDSDGVKVLKTVRCNSWPCKWRGEWPEKQQIKMKTIKYYSKNVYGNQLDYIINAGDAKVMAQLTGKKTVTGVERELVRDLCGGLVQWEQVIEPAK